MSLSIIIPDTHAPYHCKQSVEAMFGWARRHKLSTVIHLGDGADFYQVSAHDREPGRGGRFVDEAENAAKVLLRMRGLATVGHYILGNHEWRLDRYIMSKAPEMEGIVSTVKLLGLDKWTTVTPYKQTRKIGRVNYTHDLDKSGKNALRQAIQDVQANVVIGHVHRAEILYENNARGKPHVGMTPGWLGDVEKIGYRHRYLATKEWTHSFGSCEVDRSGLEHLRIHPIVDGKVLG